jgi:hypothetical protein
MTQTDLTCERMYKWFEWEHLSDPQARATATAFQELAQVIILGTWPGPERTVALRKLLEAKDAAVRAVIHPGG